MEIKTYGAVRVEIERIFPGLPPFELVEKKIDRLRDQIENGSDAALHVLRQQACLAEALACVRRGEHANYLRKIRTPKGGD